MAGLSVGIYLKANGYDVEILEKNAVAGGACIGWERKGCYIDGCIHWLAGVNPKTDFYKLWRETHAITDETEIFYQDDIYTFKFDDGKDLTLWADIERLEKSLIDFAPEDETEIKKLIKLIKKFQRIDPPSHKPVDLMNIFDLLKIAFTMGGVYFRVAKTSTVSCKDYSKHFKNERLRKIIEHFMAPNYNFMSMLYMLGHITAKDGGIPVGGSIEMIDRMEKRFNSLGGKLTKNAAVEKVLVENGVAIGVKLKNGETLSSDWVVSCVPIEHCLVDLLDGKYHDKQIDLRLKDEKTYPIYTYTTVVLKCPSSVSDKSLSITATLDQPVVFDKEYDRITFRNYSYDKTLKTDGKSCIIQATIHGNDDMYRWWKKVKDSNLYKDKKQEIAEKFLDFAKRLYPDVKDSIEVIDVVTPCTYERYLNSRHGSFQGFIHTSKGKALMRNGKLKGLKNFLLSGQWLIRSGGLPTAVMSGRFSAQRICRMDRKKFLSPTEI